jgi:hypothetical protein
MTRLGIAVLRLVAVVAAVLLLAPAAWAGATSGTVKGTVVDDGGLAIPAVLLTLRSPSLIGGAQQRESDENGDFLFVELPPGKYEMLAQKQGFGPVTQRGIDVVIGRTTSITVEMKYGGETVVVEAERRAVDTEAVAKGSTFSKDYLSRIPTGRSYQGVVNQTTGVALSSGGNAFIGGAGNDENTYLLDGVNTTDPVTGTFSMNFNYDAIDEIQVITGGFDPEYGSSLGGVVSTTTVSGGNSLEYAVYGDYSDGTWSPREDDRYAADGYRVNFSTFDYEARTGELSVLVMGPVVRDRVWFVGNYSYVRSLFQQVGVDLPRDFDAHYFFGKLTVQPSSAHRIALSFSTDPTSIDNVDGGQYTEPEARLRQAQGGYLGTLKWNWFPNPEANLETIASVQKSYIELSQVPCTHDEDLGYNPCDPTEDEIEGHIDYLTPSHQGSYGASDQENFPYFLFDDRWRAEGSSKFSVLQVDFLGKHDFKVGVEGSYLSWDQVFGYTGNMIFVDIFTNYFDPDTYQNYYWVETSGASQYTSSGYHVGAFVQDVYKPIENLTFRYGVRYDRGVMSNDAGEPILDAGVFGPRFYVSWDPWADEKTKVYGGYGRFNDVSTLGVASYLSQSGFGNHYFLGEYFDNYQAGAASNVGDYDTANRTTVIDSLSAPHSDEFMLGAEREVITDTSVKLEFTGKFTRNVYSLDETNLVFDEDGYSYIGSGDGTIDYYYRLRSPVIARRDYFQVDLALNRQFSQRWLTTLTGSYVSSRGTTQYSGTANLSNPSQVEYAYGNMETDINWQGKWSLAWDLPNDPWTTKVGFYTYVFSGLPVSRYYYSAASEITGDTYGLLKSPVGTYGRNKARYGLNVQVEQTIHVPKGELSVIAEVSNVTNSQYAAGYDQYYVDDQNRFLTVSRNSPMLASLGARYRF